MPNPNLLRRACQCIAATFALLAAHEAGIAQLAQDSVEELFRNLVLCRDVGYQRQLSRVEAGEVHQRFEAVFSFVGQHAAESIAGAPVPAAANPRDPEPTFPMNYIIY